MTPTKSGSNYSIKSNGSGPGHSSHKSKRQECQPRGEARIEDARASTSSQRLESPFDTIIESPEADITAITVVRPEPFPTANNRDMPVSVQELVYDSKKTGVGTYAKKDRGPSEGLDTHVLKRTSPTAKSLVEKPKHFVRGPEAKVGPRPRQSTPILDRNGLNNDLNHKISSNVEVENVFNFKDIPRLEQWPTFSGEGEVNHMEFMKTIDIFQEDFNTPDEYIGERLH
ncbi:hypothetical protein O181_112950 [Austropuccinia psidii MF-1]|uniref:Uncharacterized protein n=1 Tax=Austropuccinia psidii MF-1 TaxID=1389203 RepID=A0A9Q3K5F7_9BASI|nr:hypothetical protein [Austropuccinia psidii MF-1]